MITRKNISLFGLAAFIVVALLMTFILIQPLIRNYEEDTFDKTEQQSAEQIDGHTNAIEQQQLPEQGSSTLINSLDPAPIPAPNTPAPISPSPQIGDVIRFGNHNWRVLDIQDGKVFLLTKNIIDRKAFFDEFIFIPGIGYDTSWGNSNIRRWLNNDFYMSFSYEERARIAETDVIMNNNPWWYGIGQGWGEDRGNDTVDKIFLLCIYDVLYYFGYYKMPDKLTVEFCECCGRTAFMGFIPVLNDNYNSERVARWYCGRASPWWLRTIGDAGRLIVHGDGTVSSAGVNTISPNGVRPALWLYLDTEDNF